MGQQAFVAKESTFRTCHNKSLSLKNDDLGVFSTHSDEMASLEAEKATLKVIKIMIS